MAPEREAEQRDLRERSKPRIAKDVGEVFDESRMSEIVASSVSASLIQKERGKAHLSAGRERRAHVAALGVSSEAVHDHRQPVARARQVEARNFHRPHDRISHSSSEFFDGGGGQRRAATLQVGPDRIDVTERGCRKPGTSSQKTAHRVSLSWACYEICALDSARNGHFLRQKAEHFLCRSRR